MQKPLYTPKKDEPMRVAVFMSGSGTNAVKLIEQESVYLRAGETPPYHVAAVFTDNANDGNNAMKIARANGLVYVGQDLGEFARMNNRDIKDMKIRKHYFAQTVELLRKHGIDCVALAGYMVIVTSPLLEAFNDLIINVHPADLSKRTPEGRPLFTGDKAVRKAILAGEQSLASTTHVVTAPVDGGAPLLISRPVPVSLPADVTLDELKLPENASVLGAIADSRQSLLKKFGDWTIFPKTLEWVAQGRFGRDCDGVMCLDGMPIPTGYRLPTTEASATAQPAKA